MTGAGLKTALKIHDSEMRNVYLKFREHLLSKDCKYAEGYYSALFSCLGAQIQDKSVSELSWDMLHVAAHDNAVVHYMRDRTIRVLLKFLLFTVEQGFYTSEDKEQFVENWNNLNLFVNCNGYGLHEYFQLSRSCPNSIMVFKRHRDGCMLFFPTINSKNRFLLKLFHQFMHETKAYENTRYTNNASVFSYFEESIHPYTVNSYSDFNDDIYITCVRNCSRKFGESQRKETSRVTVFFQWLLTIVPENIRKTNFRLVNSVSLGYFHITKRISSGFVLVEFSPYETPKYNDKMLLLPSADDLHLRGESFRVYPFDISDIGNPTLKKWYTDFFWKGCSYRLDERASRLSILKKLFLSIDSRLSSNDTLIEIHENDIVQYITLSKMNSISASTTASRFAELKKFMAFLELEYGYRIQPVFYRMLSTSHGERNPNKEAYSYEEICQIIDYIGRQNELLKMAVLILARSEIRITSIMRMKTDCIQVVLNNGSKNEYSVRIYTKRSGNDVELVNINHYVKSYIEEAIKLTEEVRSKANSYDKDYIFLHTLQSRDSAPKMFGENAIINIINKACESLKIPKKGTEGIRNYYTQHTRKYLDDKGISLGYLDGVTGHSLETQIRDYDKVNMIEFCKLHYQVNIGRISLKGTITSKTEIDEKLRVGNKCGFCTGKHCTFQGNLDCFLCESFVTTLSCIPFYEKEISILDEYIKSETIEHEVDFLVSKKKLLVAYLSKLLLLKGEVVTYE